MQYLLRHVRLTKQRGNSKESVVVEQIRITVKGKEPLGMLVALGTITQVIEWLRILSMWNAKCNRFLIV